MADVAQQSPAQLSQAQVDMTQGNSGGGTSRAAAKLGDKIARVPEQTHAATITTLVSKMFQLVIPK